MLDILIFTVVSVCHGPQLNAERNDLLRIYGKGERINLGTIDISMQRAWKLLRSSNSEDVTQGKDFFLKVQKSYPGVVSRFLRREITDELDGFAAANLVQQNLLADFILARRLSDRSFQESKYLETLLGHDIGSDAPESDLRSLHLKILAGYKTQTGSQQFALYENLIANSSSESVRTEATLALRNLFQLDEWTDVEREGFEAAYQGELDVLKPFLSAYVETNSQETHKLIRRILGGLNLKYKNEWKKHRDLELSSKLNSLQSAKGTPETAVIIEAAKKAYQTNAIKNFKAQYK